MPATLKQRNQEGIAMTEETEVNETENDESQHTYDPETQVVFSAELAQVIVAVVENLPPRAVNGVIAHDEFYSRLKQEVRDQQRGNSE